MALNYARILKGQYKGRIARIVSIYPNDYTIVLGYDDGSSHGFRLWEVELCSGPSTV